MIKRTTMKKTDGTTYVYIDNNTSSNSSTSHNSDIAPTSSLNELIAHTSSNNDNVVDVSSNDTHMNETTIKSILCNEYNRQNKHDYYEQEQQNDADRCHQQDYQNLVLPRVVSNFPNRRRRRRRRSNSTLITTVHDCCCVELNPNYTKDDMMCDTNLVCCTGYGCFYGDSQHAVFNHAPLCCCCSRTTRQFPLQRGRRLSSTYTVRTFHITNRMSPVIVIIVFTFTIILLQRHHDPRISFVASTKPIHSTHARMNERHLQHNDNFNQSKAKNIPRLKENMTKKIKKKFNSKCSIRLFSYDSDNEENGSIIHPKEERIIDAMFHFDQKTRPNTLNNNQYGQHTIRPTLRFQQEPNDDILTVNSTTKFGNNVSQTTDYGANCGIIDMYSYTNKTYREKEFHSTILLPQKKARDIKREKKSTVSYYGEASNPRKARLVKKKRGGRTKRKTSSTSNDPYDCVPTTPWVRNLLSRCNGNNIECKTYTHRNNTNNEITRPLLLVPVPKEYCSDNFNLVLLLPVIEEVGQYYYKKHIEQMNNAKSYAMMDSNSKSNSNVVSNSRMRRRNSEQSILVAQKYWIYQQALQLLINEQPVLAENTIGKEQGNFKTNHHRFVNDDDTASISVPDFIDKAATVLYLLLHQRYVLSRYGMDAIRQRFYGRTNQNIFAENNKTNNNNPYIDPIFGRCPRYECRGMPLLPIGSLDYYSLLTNDTLNNDSHYRLKWYCGCCKRTFIDDSINSTFTTSIDGCAWGTSFCHVFLMVHGMELFQSWLSPKTATNNNNVDDNVKSTFSSSIHLHPYESSDSDYRIFGFKIHPQQLQQHP